MPGGSTLSSSARNRSPMGRADRFARKYWDLTDISQLWLRDLLWDHLRHCALGAAGKRPSQANVYQRITQHPATLKNLAPTP